MVMESKPQVNGAFDDSDVEDKLTFIFLTPGIWTSCCLSFGNSKFVLVRLGTGLTVDLLREMNYPSVNSVPSFS